MLFFIILSWYNALLAVYNYLIGYDPDRVKSNLSTMLATIGYAILWTLLAMFFYIVLSTSGKLEEENVSTHPLLRDEALRIIS